MIRILLADSHTILREGVRLILSREAGFTVVGEAACGEEAITKANILEPDVVVLEARMPDLDGTQVARQMHTQLPNCSILFLTISSTDNELLYAIKSGARGFLPKTVDSHQLIDSIRRVHAGEAVFPPRMMARVLDQLSAPEPQSLTLRELDTLSLIGEGLTNKEIARQLAVSENTVKTHVRHILEKLQLRNRAEAAVYAERNHLVSTPSFRRDDALNVI